MSGGVPTELDRSIAAALKATARSTAPLGGAIRRLNSIHQTLKAQLASGELTDAQYAQKVRELHVRFVPIADAASAREITANSRRASYGTGCACFTAALQRD